VSGDGGPPPEPEEGEAEAGTGETVEEILYSFVLTEEQFAELAAREEFVLSVTEKGFGVRTSAFDYRITGRGGVGILNIDVKARGDAVVAVFPVGHNDQIMLVTDGGMVIRCPVHDIRIARRRSQGVVIFKVGDGERVVSVARLPEESPGETDENGGVEEPDDAPDDQQASEGDV
jgi:DNA gyrase subunit A